MKSKKIIYMILISIIFMLIVCVSGLIFSKEEYISAVFGEKTTQNNSQYFIKEMEISELNDEQLEVFEMINNNRKENGLQELKPSIELQKCAEIKAKDIVEKQYFSHYSPTYGTPFDLMKQQGISYSIAGENLAGNINSKNAVEAWMNSDSHRENILEERFKYTGIAILDSKVYGKVFVQMFIG